jgi:hypothetical protein
MSAGVRPNLKSLVINVAEPAPYPLLRRIVSGLNESAHQTRPSLSASGRTFRAALLRTFHSRRFFVAARYDIVTAGEYWVTVVASAGGPAGSRKSAKSRPYLWVHPDDDG